MHGPNQFLHLPCVRAWWVCIMECYYADSCLQGKVEEPNTSPLTTRGLTPISEPVAAAHTIADRVQRAKSANRMNNGVEAAPTGIGDVKTKALDV